MGIRIVGCGNGDGVSAQNAPHAGHFELTHPSERWTPQGTRKSAGPHWRGFDCRQHYPQTLDASKECDARSLHQLFTLPWDATALSSLLPLASLSLTKVCILANGWKLLSHSFDVEPRGGLRHADGCSLDRIRCQPVLVEVLSALRWP